MLFDQTPKALIVIGCLAGYATLTLSLIGFFSEAKTGVRQSVANRQRIHVITLRMHKFFLMTHLLLGLTNSVNGINAG
jgi:hypothetical protein